MKVLRSVLALLASVLVIGTASATQPQLEDTALVIEFLVPGGRLPVGCTLKQAEAGDEQIRIIEFQNAAERIECTHVHLTSHEAERGTTIEIDLALPHYGTRLEWTMTRDSADSLFQGAGVMTKARPNGEAEIMFLVREVRPASGQAHVPLDQLRFREIPSSAGSQNLSGRWSARFESEDDPAIAEIDVDERGIASATIMTRTGDYRYLAGRVDGDRLRLSVFDGAHAFLFDASLGDDGVLRGDFWSGDWWHDRWSAVRDENAELPDAFEGTTWVDGSSLEDLVFVDLNGAPASVRSVLDRLGGEVRIIKVFGTWCPNCTDATRDLAALQAEYGDRGLRILGLAFEYSDDLQRVKPVMQAYRDRYAIEWPILFAGLSDKAGATELLPILDRVRTYPTLIFLDEDNRPIAVHAGYTGPATGAAHESMLSRFRALLDEHLPK